MNKQNKSVTVSVIIITFNRLEFFKRAFNSVVKQSYSPLEIIIVEDGSNSGVEKWLIEKGLRDVQYIRHERNLGLAAARNTGLTAANGEYIAYLDDDDEWKPERLLSQIKVLKSLTAEKLCRVGLIYCGIEIRNSDNNMVRERRYPECKGPIRKKIMESGMNALPSTNLFSKKALEDVGGLDETLTSCIDDDIWMALAVRGYEAYGVNEDMVITYDRRNRITMVNNTLQRIEGARAFVRKWQPVYEKWMGAEEGKKYAGRYLTDVMISLSLYNIISGSTSEACFVLRENYKICNDKQYCFREAVRVLLPAWLKSFVPAIIKIKLKKLFRRQA